MTPAPRAQSVASVSVSVAPVAPAPTTAQSAFAHIAQQTSDMIPQHTSDTRLFGSWRQSDWLWRQSGANQGPGANRRQSAPNLWRQSILAPIRRQSWRQSNLAPIKLFPLGNTGNPGEHTGQPAQEHPRVVDWLQAPINWLIWRQSGANQLIIVWLLAPINADWRQETLGNHWIPLLNKGWRQETLGNHSIPLLIGAKRWN